MQKKSMVVIILFGLFGIMNLSVCEQSLADDFSSFYDFTGEFDPQDNSITYTKLKEDNSGSYSYSWSQTIDFDPAAASVENAVLTLTYAALTGNAEVWFLKNDGEKISFQLTHYSSEWDWYGQDFNITSLFENFSGESITIGLTLYEDANGYGKDLYLDKCEITGQYSPVPVPSSALLLGSSLLGLVGLASRRRG